MTKDLAKDLDSAKDLDLDLDNTWVETYKHAEETYNEFYNEKVTTIKLFYLYINADNTVVCVKQAFLPLTSPGVVPREQLIALITANQTVTRLKYKLLSLVRYNINLLPTEITDFIHAPAHTYGDRFLVPETYRQDIYFADTINIFQDLNALYFLFTAVPPPRTGPAHKFTQKLKASIKKRYTRHK